MDPGVTAFCVPSWSFRAIVVDTLTARAEDHPYHAKVPLLLVAREIRVAELLHGAARPADFEVFRNAVR